jgi:N-acetylneuraminic acid mutarotase
MGASTVPGSGNVIFTNCTLTANTATGGNGDYAGSGYGGAVFNLDGSLTSLNTTVAGNTVSAGAAGLGPKIADGGAVYSLAFGNNINSGGSVGATLTLDNSILANTIGGTDLVSNVVNGNGTNVGTINGSYSLVQSRNLTGTTLAGGVIISSDDPHLAPLAANGGPTETMALTESSSAFAKGNLSLAPATDQRGLPRSINDQVDLGAFQLQPALPTVAPVTVTPSAGNAVLTLTATVAAAGAGVVNVGQVQFTVNGQTASGYVQAGSATALMPIPTGIASGQYVIAADYTDGSNGAYREGSSSGVLTVSPELLPTSSASLTAGAINLALTEGTLFNGTIVHFGTNSRLETAGDFTAVIHWGDGTEDSAGIILGGFGQFAVSGSHTFARAGAYPLQVTITDRAGNQITASGGPTWASAAAMPTARFGLAAAAGPDGRIYAIGGYNNGALNTVEAYDPIANGWTTVTSMPTARYQLAAVAGPDGRIYAIGGNDGTTFLSTVEAYDPVTDTWSTLAPMPTARYLLAAATGLDGRIYAIGGFGANGAANTVEAYNPASNTWATVASMPTARTALAAATGPDGRLYAIGGTAGLILNTVEAYDPARNVWSTVAALPGPRSLPTAAVGPDGRIYAIGGFTDGVAANTVLAYDSVSNRWAPARPLPAPFAGGAVAAMGGSFYAVGAQDSNGAPLANVEVASAGPSAVVSELPASQLVISTMPARAAGTAGTFTVRAVNAYGEVVPSYSGTVSFYATGQASLPAPATLTNGTGTYSATFFTAGLQTLSVTDGTISGQQNNIVVTAAASASVTVLSSPQSTEVNTPFAQSLQVVVFDAYDNAVPEAPVTFTANASGADGGGADGTFLSPGGLPLSNAIATTNSTGVATAPVLTANTAAGTFTVTASAAPAAPVTFVLTNTPGAPAGLTAVTGTSQSTRIGKSFATPLRVFVVDRYGNQTDGVGIGVTFTAPASGPSGTFTPPASGAGGTVTGSGAAAIVVTDANSMATALPFTANTRPGNFTITVTASGLTSDSFRLTNIGDPGALTLTPSSPQSATVGQRYLAPFLATVTDVNGYPVSDEPVTFTAPSTGAGGAFAESPKPVASVTVRTNGSGQAIAPAFKANTTAGAFQVKVSVAKLPNATFSLTNVAGPLARMAAVGSSSSAAPLTVRVTDAFGNPVAGASVVFSASPAAPASGVVPAASTTSAQPASALFAGGAATLLVHTDKHGIASAALLMSNDSAGSFTVTVSLADEPAIEALFHLTNKHRHVRPRHVTPHA